MEKQEIFILYRWNQISPDIFFINDPSIDLDKCVEKTVRRLLARRAIDEDRLDCIATGPRVF